MPTTINADTVVGGAVITGDTSGVLELQAAGNRALTVNSSRAVGVGATPDYGTSGQALVSGGSAAAPSWGTLGVSGGGTGQTSYTNGQLLIGNTTGNTLAKATLTAGTGISITNGAGSITIATSGGAGGTGGAIFLANNFGGF